jgi:glycosyltransferase involved in cell wall biosynthesis
VRRVLITAPDTSAVSGIATHVNQLLQSPLQESFRLGHFRAGGEGLAESRFRRVLRRALTPAAWVGRLWRDGRPLVHINTSLDRNGLARDALLLLIARTMGCPVIWQVHGGLAPSEFCPSRAKEKWLRALLARADRVVVITRADEAAYRAFVPPGRLIRIVNSIDAVAFDGGERRQDAGGELRLSFLGRLIPAKGVMDVVDAVAAVREAGVRVILSIAGSGPADGALRQRVLDLNLQDQVVFLGTIGGAQKQRLLSESDLFVLPTWHRERMPYALLEAMAAGAVPITSAAGDIDELIVAGQHGFILEPHRPDLIAGIILRVASDRAGLAQLSSACRQRVRECYGLPRMAGEFSRLYRNLCGT